MKERKTSTRPIRKRVRETESDEIRLNKYIANAGVCSRREADELIKSGAVIVNGKVVTELGTKVLPTDNVQFGNKTLSLEKNRYILLNKPKAFLTTVSDPQKRNTVMDLIKDACPERVYPVGRLDRNTTGLLLFTNDGTITKKLTHPRYGIRKIYHIVLDKPLTRADLQTIADGIELDDGFIKVDSIEFITDAKDKSEIGMELHSGRNRVVRRIFEKLEYKVEKLDRIYFAGLTKKNLPRGKWRFLEEKEINMLKMISSKK
ncbi:MAG: rRNA pseudouridine synthase [Bacteroidia bacterium]|nr:rRNA pseudouridine synthase [Bacteroidia bacterium]